MDEETFDLIDGIIGGRNYHDDREAAMELLSVGAREGTLKDVVRVIADRYAISQMSVVEWYTECLIRQIREIALTIVTIQEVMGENVRAG